MKKLKVLQFNNTEEFEGGTELFVKKLCRELREKYDILEVSLSHFKGREGSGKVVIKLPKSRLLRLFFGTTLYPGLYAQLRKILKKFNPDIVHLHNIDKYPFTIINAFKGYKIVKTVNDYGIVCPTMWAVRKNTMKVCEAGYGLKCLRSCLNPFEFVVHAWLSHVKDVMYKKQVDVFLSPSKTQKRYLDNHGYKNVRLMENFLLHDAFSEETKKIPGKFFLYIGGLSVQKGLYVMISGFNRFNDGKYKLYIIGGGEEEKRLRERYKDNENIVFLGRVSDEDKFTFMRSCMAVIIPSLWIETGPHVGMETMLENKPIIASDIGGMTDYVVDGKNGLLFKRGSAADLGDKLLYFAKKPTMFRSIKSVNKEQLKKYSTKRHIRRLGKIYQDLHNA